VRRIGDVARHGLYAGHAGCGGMQGVGVAGVDDASPVVLDERGEQRPAESL
jgi:hypothetical protein